MPRLEIYPHPVRLLHVAFPEFQFKLGAAAEPPYFFPPFDLSAEARAVKHVDQEKRRLYVSLTVASAKGTARGKKKPAASFKVRVEGLFECAEFEDAERALTEFSNSTTPYTLLWPYVRPMLAQALILLGLPPYHLPLAVGWTTTDEGAEAQVELSQ